MSSIFKFIFKKKTSNSYKANIPKLTLREGFNQCYDSSVFHARVDNQKLFYNVTR